MKERRPLDAAEVEGLVRAHQASLWRYLRILGCDAALAEDLAQETFLRVLDRPLRDPDALGAWLRRTARNLWLRQVERLGREPAAIDPAAAERALAVFEREDGGGGWLERLGDCLQRLAPREREFLEPRYGQELPRRQIAVGQGLSEDGVKSVLSRALSRLRTCMGEEKGDG